jgi:hypothetical protein
LFSPPSPRSRPSLPLLRSPTMLASSPRRQSSTTFYQPSYTQIQHHSSSTIIPQHHNHKHQHQHQQQYFPSPPLSQYNDITATANIYSFGTDQPLFDFQPQQYDSNPSQSLMQSEQSNGSWLSNGQLTPTSTSRAHHHRESSLSSLGSAGPASPYTANTSNPHVAGDLYHDFHDYHQSSSKPLTPAHTPSQDQFLSPHYSNFYANSSHIPFSMSHDGLQKQMGDAELMPAPSVASHDSPSTPPSYESEERQKKCIQKFNAKAR